MSTERAKVNEKKTRTKNSEKILDFIAKIACLVIAFFIWFYAMSTDVVSLEREFTVPVLFENETTLFEKTGWSVLSGKDNSVVVTIKGKRNIVNQITESDIYAFVDVSGVESAGMQVLDIKISAPTECEIVNTSASSISPYIDKRVTRNVPVKVLHTYEITSGYQLDDPVANISEVAVTGPESELQKISAAQAELALGKVTETVNTRSTLVLVDEAGNPISSKYVSMTTKNVNITVKLYALKDVPLTVGYKYGYFNENNAKVTVTPNVITLRGEPSVLENMDKLEVAVLDEKKFVKNSTQSVLINVPEGVTAMTGETTATVNVEHINTDVKHITVGNITLANSGGLECELQTESLNIMLRGPHALLSQVKEENITLTADMKNYSSGSGIMVVPVSVKLSSEFEGSVYELETYNVTVNVK
ncbi:MAG: hypothetical protein IJD37_00805 [Clostridia bacterium]|nr:hypothetical protein [Clostridia bacterium]